MNEILIVFFSIFMDIFKQIYCGGSKTAFV